MWKDFKQDIVFQRCIYYHYVYKCGLLSGLQPGIELGSLYINTVDGMLAIPIEELSSPFKRRKALH